MQIVQTTLQKAQTLVYSSQNKARCSSSTTGANVYNDWWHMSGVEKGMIIYLGTMKGQSLTESQNHVLTVWHELVIPNFI